MNPLVALPFSGLLVVIVVLAWTGFRDRRPTEVKAEGDPKSPRQMLVAMLKVEEQREAEASARK